MNKCEPGPSAPKKPKKTNKIIFKRFLTEEELEKMLYESDDDLENPTFVDEDLVISEDEDDREDDIEDVSVAPSRADTLGTNSPIREQLIKELPEEGREEATATPEIGPEYTWTENGDLEEFTFSNRPELLLDIGGTPMDFFETMFDKSLFTLIVQETNKYAEEVFLEKGAATSSRISLWKPITPEEFKIFLGLFFHMGTIHMARLQDYWKTDRLFDLRCFSDYMSRDRFLIILRCLHFSQNPLPGEPRPQDRLFKIRPLMNYFNKTMQSVYYPGQNLCIDESMVLWRGRLVFRQYIQNKRHKYGVKFYMLTEPTGLIQKFSVYTGALDDFGGKGHAAKVVLHLLEEKLNAGHSLYMDNYYNSVDLSKQLLDKKTSYTDKRGNEKEKPLPIIHYNKNMGGIDRQDQFMAYYPCARKTVRWYKKIGLHIFQLLFLNSYFLYKKYHSTRMSFYDFRLIIIRQLLPESMHKPRPKSGPSTNYDHFVSYCPRGPSGKILRKKCRFCLLFPALFCGTP